MSVLLKALSVLGLAVGAVAAKKVHTVVVEQGEFEYELTLLENKPGLANVHHNLGVNAGNVMAALGFPPPQAPVIHVPTVPPLQ